MCDVQTHPECSAASAAVVSSRAVALFRRYALSGLAVLGANDTFVTELFRSGGCSPAALAAGATAKGSGGAVGCGGLVYVGHFKLPESTRDPEEAPRLVVVVVLAPRRVEVRRLHSAVLCLTCAAFV